MLSAIFSLTGIVLTFLALWKSHEDETKQENLFLWLAVAAISMANILD